MTSVLHARAALDSAGECRSVLDGRASGFVLVNGILPRKLQSFVICLERRNAEKEGSTRVGEPSAAKHADFSIGVRICRVLLGLRGYEVRCELVEGIVHVILVSSSLTVKLECNTHEFSC